MIELKKVRKTFNDIKALDEINLSIKKGSIFGLLGSNGAGKTTLLRTIAGIFKQDDGELLIDKEKVFENNNIKNKLFFIADQPYFFFNHSITAMAKFYQGIYSNWNQERFLQLKEVFNIDMKKNINKLSKGMQRQVAFWLALSTMPEILVLDEPVDGLDPVMRKTIKNLLIQDVADRNITVIISSHNLREIEDLCDHIGILHNGKMVIERDLDDMKLEIHKVQISFKKDIPKQVLDNLNILHKEERGSISILIIRGVKNIILEQLNKYNPHILDILPLTLEEIFIYEMEEVGYAIESIVL